ncbi:MAG: GNAT family N-acetyltransferase [Bacteroidetes bacterium]|nr:GNAT family N-acetyltransferase [Bacteroidota bacterium]
MQKIILEDFEIFIARKEHFSQVISNCSSFNKMQNYKSLFSSKEWIESYINIYQPSKVLLIKVNCICGNYMVLEVKNEEILFLGDPFNDFNLFSNVIDCKNHNWLAPILFIKQYFNISIKLTNIETDYSLNFKATNLSKGLRKELDSSSRDKVSKKIIRMYRKGEQISYERVTPENETTFFKLLDALLKQRIESLKDKESTIGNDFSLNQNFSNFINEVCHKQELKNNIFIDYSSLHNQELLAIGLYFHTNNKILYYLRCHFKETSKFSYGLMLDYWSITKSISNRSEVLDFARGNESYKYRLGSEEYNLIDYEI